MTFTRVPVEDFMKAPDKARFAARTVISWMLLIVTLVGTVKHQVQLTVNKVQMTTSLIVIFFPGSRNLNKPA